MGRNRALPTADGIGGTIVLLRRQHARAKMQSPLHDTRFETNSGKKAAPHIPASEGKGVAIYRQNQRKRPQPPAAETEKRPNPPEAAETTKTEKHLRPLLLQQRQKRRNPPEAAETAKAEKHRWSRPAARSEKRRRPFEKRESLSPERKIRPGRRNKLFLTIIYQVTANRADLFCNHPVRSPCQRNGADSETAPEAAGTACKRDKWYKIGYNRLKLHIVALFFLHLSKQRKLWSTPTI